MGLRAKFNIIMISVFLAGLGLSAYFARELATKNARGQMLQEASIIMRQATAVRSYTSGELRPLLAEQMNIRFLPHSVPSFAAQTVFRTMQRDFRDYSYKEAALNPTNPSDRATEWEADIINMFKRNENLSEHVGTRDTPAGAMLTFSRPFRLTDRACLSCHSTPAAAPPTMIDLYGPSNGFGWVFGDVIGAQIVSVPLSVALARADDILYAFVSMLTAIFIAILLVMNFLLHFVIIRPIQRMDALARRAAEGDLEGEELEVKSRDEVASLARSFNLMRRSLARSMSMLEAI
ncbi:DUF3365 domain-containing protein [Belnapia sp. T18]|uniref:DUF3365 domain-containing protein n=1 Tax=Belnapia arida TaxID=2804533 RepID=A0ABS1UA77_9PROT|nr:DUF3365 domain-containing protein [Belnapia arida]MBL6081576.1 DUF3365 domain-containing protein [Belnapia arida]